MAHRSEEQQKFIDLMKKYRETIYFMLHFIPDDAKRNLEAQKILNQFIFHYFLQVSIRKKEEMMEKLKSSTPASHDFHDEVMKTLDPAVDDPADSFRFFRSANPDAPKQPEIPNQIITAIYNTLDSIQWSFDDSNEQGVISPRTLGEIALGSSDRKQRGVYYTPPKLVNKIASSAIEKYLLKKLFPAEEKPDISLESFPNLREDPAKKDRIYQLISELTILDPSAGSGEFLVSAHDFLFDLTKKILFNDSSQAVQPKQDLQLASEIYDKNIFGVELDECTVENCKLRIWVSLLRYINKVEDIRLFPKLNSLMAGNSLLGYDFRDAHREPFFKGTEFGTYLHDMLEKNSEYLQEWEIKQFMTKQKILHWIKAFPKPFNRGWGFKIILGNPPWGSHFSEIEKVIYRNLYLRETRMDLFFLFLVRSTFLLTDDGVLSFLVPDILLHKNYPKTRYFLLSHFRILSLEHVGLKFDQVIMYAAVFTGQREQDEIKRDFHEMLLVRQLPDLTIHASRVPQNLFHEMPDYKFNLDLTLERWRTLKNIQNRGMPLKEILSCHEGIHSGNVRNKIFTTDSSVPHARPLIFGRGEVQRYHITWQGRYVRYDPALVDKTRGEYAGFGKPEYFEMPKLLICRTGYQIKAALDRNSFYVSNNLFTCTLKDKIWSLEYLLGVINSTLMTFFFHLIHPRGKQIYAEIKISHLNQFPIPKPTPFERKVIVLVVKILIFLKEIEETDLFNFFDWEILDPLIYELYFQRLLEPAKYRPAFMTGLNDIFQEFKMNDENINLTLILDAKERILFDHAMNEAKEKILNLRQVQIIQEFLSSMFRNS
ncbi:MAG: TaqI-like C-terminal specificity domain-containing protein [Candidatus Helarchaeota archaeon]